jgi:hypothetical protein
MNTNDIKIILSEAFQKWGGEYGMKIYNLATLALTPVFRTI